MLSLCVWGCGDCDDPFLLQNSSAAAPTAVNDQFAALGNTPLTVNAAQGVLANDTHNGGVVISFDATSANGGTVAVNLNGSFQYVPAVGFLGNDTFNYTVSNLGGSSTATVTIAITTRAI